VKKIYGLILLIIFSISFGTGFLISTETAGACNCVQRCKLCPPDCLCVRSGPPCNCYECWCT